MTTKETVEAGVKETATAAKKDRHPNIKLAAKAQPLGAGRVTLGMRVVCEMPDAETQRAGFYIENAAELVRLYPDRFLQLSHVQMNVETKAE